MTYVFKLVLGGARKPIRSEQTARPSTTRVLDVSTKLERNSPRRFFPFFTRYTPKFVPRLRELF